MNDHTLNYKYASLPDVLYMSLFNWGVDGVWDPCADGIMFR